MRNNRAARFAEAAAEIKSGPRLAHPVVSAVQFAHMTNTDGGASMNVHTNQIAKPGDRRYFVGGEPDSKGNRIPTTLHGDTEIDASGGYADLQEATGLMKSRNEKALWDMENMDEVRNPDYVEGAGVPPVREPATTSDLSPADVLRHKARLMGVGGRNPAMTLGTWRDVQ